MTEHKIEHNADVLALGHLVTGFQFLESELLRIVIECNMPGDQRAVSVLASQLSFRNLTAALSALVNALSNNDTLKEETRKLAGQLNQTNAERNTFVHSHYHLAQWDIHGQSILRRKTKVDVKNGLRECESWFDPKDIETLIEKMGKQCESLHEIEQKLISEGIIPTLPE
jgi:hypothetical protein